MSRRHFLLPLAFAFTIALHTTRADDRPSAPDNLEGDPVEAEAANSRALDHLQSGEYAEALEDFTRAVRLNPQKALYYNNRAFFRATCPEARFRNGQRAVADATKACELDRWKNSNSLDTLAAAYAEKGEFEEAKRQQARAIELSADVADKRRMRSRLSEYAAGKPYRQAGR